MMGVFSLLILLAIIGFVAWVIIRLVPMPDPFPKVIVAVTILLVLLILLRALGLDMALPRLLSP